jgi:hypothetical protein
METVDHWKSKSEGEPKSGDRAMRYWEACEAQVTVEEAIEECRVHQIEAIVRESDSALVDVTTGDLIVHPDEQADYCGADILGYLGY